MITGATGDVGKSLCDSLSAAGYELLTSSRKRPDEWGYPHQAFDITELAAIVATLTGVDALVHLARQREPSAGFDELVGPNIRGSYNAFEAALRSGVQRVVFASSVNVSNGRTREQPISDEIVCPSSLYGASKAFGEELARHYSETHELSCICLRMGWTLPFADSKGLLSNSPMDSDYAKRVYLSAEDFAQLVQRVIDAPDELKFGVFNALSDNRDKLLDISFAQSQLGYKPQHDAFAITDSP